MSFTKVEDVLYHAMKDLLSAEKQFRDALSALAEAAQDEELSEAFRDHRSETLGHIERLERAFVMLGRSERSEKCDAAAGLVKEGEGIIEEGGETPAFDVMLTAAGRKTEHYEIASYEDAVSYAEALGHPEITALLSETLKEERAASKTLESIAGRLMNTYAEQV